MAELGVKQALKTVGLRYGWKLLELISIIFFARVLPISEFGAAFFTVTIVLFFTSLMKISYDEKDTSKIKNFYNSLSLGILLFAILMLAVTFSLPQSGPMEEVLRFSSLILMFSSLSTLPDMFFTNRGSIEKVYRANLFSQVLLLAVSIILLAGGYGLKAVMYGYIVYYLAKAFELWRWFPFRIRPKLGSFGDVLRAFRGSSRYFSTSLSYLVLLISGIAFGFDAFAVLFLSYYLGYFLYENLTLFTGRLLIPAFSRYEEDLQKMNFVRVMEYFSLALLPLSALGMVLAKDFVLLALGSNWSSAADPLIILILAGMIKGISETARIIFEARDKVYAIARIHYIEALAVAVLLPLAIYLLGPFGPVVTLLSSALLTSALYAGATSRITKINIAAVSQDYLYILLSAAICALAVGFLKELFDVKTVMGLSGMFFAGLVLDLVITFFFNRDIYKRFVRFMFTLGEQ